MIPRLLLSAATLAVTVTAGIAPATAYYNLPDFDIQQTQPQQVKELNWKVIDQVLYYAVTPTADGRLAPGLRADVAAALVSAAHKNKKLAGVVVGGTNGTANLSSFITTAANRTTLASNIIQMVEIYNFDSLEFDWVFDSATIAQDVANLALLLPEIRQLNSKLPLGMTLGWSEARSDVSSLSKHLDWADLFAFYWWNPNNATTTGAVSPTVNCQSQSYNGPTGPSVQALISQWTDAGFPASKMVLGFAPSAYNYTGVPTISTASDSSTSLFQPGSLDAANIDGVTSTSVMIKDGVLSSNAKDGNGSYQRFWDNCTETPYLISQDDSTLISYEDPDSIAAKVSLARSAGFAGVSLYGAADDAPGQLLLQVAKKIIQSHRGHGLSRKLIALWVFIPIIALSLAGLAVYIYLRRRRAHARAVGAVPAMISKPSSVHGSFVSSDGSVKSLMEEKGYRVWCALKGFAR